MDRKLCAVARKRSQATVDNGVNSMTTIAHSNTDRIKRFGKTALAIVLTVAAVTAIVVAKSAIWIPRFHP
jgi:hypothetical protein